MNETAQRTCVKIQRGEGRTAESKTCSTSKESPHRLRVPADSACIWSPFLRRGARSLICTRVMKAPCTLSQERLACGTARGLREHMWMSAGDFVYIPANLPHLPYNPSATTPCVGLIARTDPNEQESVTLLDIADPGVAER